MTAAFVHLKVHTEYSLVDGLVRLNELVKETSAMAMPAVAITDLNDLFGMVKFYRAAMKAKIKPIIGANVALAEGADIFYITLLCQNEVGYQNLTKLISRAFLEGQTATTMPTIQWDWLVENNAGLLVLSGGREGDVGRALLDGNSALAETRLARWQDIFADRYYFELVRTHRADEETYIHAAVDLAQQNAVPVVATNDVRFLKAEDFEAHEARVCIAQGVVLDDPKRLRAYSSEQYLKSPEQMQALFADIPEALENTVAIMQRCNVKLTLGKPCLPAFPVPQGQTEQTYLSDESWKGLRARLNILGITDKQKMQAYEKRLQRELDVVISMGFAGYYLIVADFIQWAKSQGIPVGPGRGSGAGSLIAYVLDITELDPIQHELLFERFLNPERVSMPDFDIDFCMEQRDRVIDYVAKRYGRSAVSQIITFGTMAAKAVVRDVGRVLGFPYGFCDKIAKLIPFELGITLDKALIQEPQLRERYEEEDDVATLIDLAKKLEGITRNAGKHAGGVVIAPGQLTDFTPLYCEAGGGNLVTQFDKDDVEAVGLVKFDFLGLRTLTIIDWAVRSINQRLQKQGQKPIDIRHIPLDDPKTYTLLKACTTTAVFQLESRGMKELIRRLQPDCFEEITALVALFRPGPLQSGMVDDFIDRKHGRSEVRYLHPDLEPILSPTYGVILYQEQVMQIAQVLANYSLGGADILRRAMGKKKPEEMAKQREIFLKGATQRDVDSHTAETIFDLMEKFAGYGFNKSHSAAYALIAYQTAWLKAHYPAEFMAAVLSSDMDNTDKVVGFLEECFAMGLRVLPPNVNTGRYPFTVNAQGDIVYGIGAIKGVGEGVVQHLVEVRERDGIFTDLFSLCQRLDSHKVNRRVLEAFILSGALDDFGQPRAVLSASVDKALKASEQHHRNASFGQNDLFGGVADAATVQDTLPYVTVEPWSMKAQLEGEKETLGWYISGHPIDLYETEIQRFTTTHLADLARHIRKDVTVAGILQQVRPIFTKSGRRMAILTLEDRSGRLEVTVFSKLFDQISRELETDRVFVIKGKVEEDEYTGGVRMVAESVRSLCDVRENLIKRIVIRATGKAGVENVLAHLPVLIESQGVGQCPVTIAYEGSAAHAELKLGDAWKMKPSEEVISKIRQLFGEQAVSLEYA